MEAVAEAAFQYLKENWVATLAIALVAGFAAVKTVAVGKQANIVLCLIVGLIGAFLGQFVILYFNLKEILDQIPEFRIFFDLLAAYIASFVVASLVHFVKPL